MAYGSPPFVLSNRRDVLPRVSGTHHGEGAADRVPQVRHTWAALFFQAGAPANVVQERLGHKRIEIPTDPVRHARQEQSHDAPARMVEPLLKLVKRQ